MTAFAGQREVLYEANIQIEERRLPGAVARHDLLVHDRAIIPVVAVVLSVEANDRRVRQARARDQDGIELEAQRQVGNGAEVEAVAHIEESSRPVGREVERIERRDEGEGSEVGIVVAGARQRVVRHQSASASEAGSSLSAACRRRTNAPRMSFTSNCPIAGSGRCAGKIGMPLVS